MGFCFNSILFLGFQKRWQLYQNPSTNQKSCSKGNLVISLLKMQVSTYPGKLDTLSSDHQAPSHHHHHHPTAAAEDTWHTTTLSLAAAPPDVPWPPRYLKNIKCYWWKEVVFLLLIEMCHFWQISILPLRIFRILRLHNSLCQRMECSMQGPGFWVVVLRLMRDFTRERVQGTTLLSFIIYIHTNPDKL